MGTENQDKIEDYNFKNKGFAEECRALATCEGKIPLSYVVQLRKWLLAAADRLEDADKLLDDAYGFKGHGVSS